jgi:hypothetical protein
MRFIALAALAIMLAVGAPDPALAAGGHAPAGGHPGAVVGHSGVGHSNGHFEGHHFVGHHGFHRGFHGGVFVAPVVPFYGYYDPPVYQPPAPAYWYYCPSYGAYYPSVPTCPDNWVPVPAY